MAGRQIVVIGLGRFGTRAARTLYQLGHDVMAIDLDDRKILFHKDGKTASIDLVANENESEFIILTNGKPDASINKTAFALSDP